MATPARKLILDNLATVLASIAVSGGYKTTVATVERVIREPGDKAVGANAVPLVGFAPIRETHEYQPGNQIRVVMEASAVGHVLGTSDSDRTDKLSNLLDDLVAALNLDTTRGANAVSTTVKTCETDEGSPYVLPDSRGGSGTCVVNFDVVYFRTAGST
jgi:protein involved in polysaccharide export with SLBB domain